MHPATIYRTLPDLILASASPRRRQLLEAMGLACRVEVASIDEKKVFAQYAASCDDTRVTQQALVCEVARQKAMAIPLRGDALVLAADTAVFLGDQRLDKPKDLAEARATLGLLAGQTHTVISAFCLRSMQQEFTVADTVRVTMACLSPEEIEYYISSTPPLDKAGAYGIQEWIGWVGISRIDGAYATVMGLPTHLLHRTLLHDILRS